jgi:hypothetical protein
MKSLSGSRPSGGPGSGGEPPPSPPCAAACGCSGRAAAHGDGGLMSFFEIVLSIGKKVRSQLLEQRTTV